MSISVIIAGENGDLLSSVYSHLKCHSAITIVDLLTYEEVSKISCHSPQIDVLVLFRDEGTVPDVRLLNWVRDYESRILLADTQINDATVKTWLSLGIPGIIRFPCDPDLMAAAVISLHESGTFFDDCVRMIILKNHFIPQSFVMGDLTPAEARVVSLLRKGWTNRQIARQLGTAERTVKGHLSHIYAKLQVTSRAEAVGVLSRACLL